MRSNRLYQKVIGAINEAAIDVIIIPKNPSSFFTVLVAPSINRPDFSDDSTILIISSISSFEMNKTNLFPALCPFIFLLNLSNTEEVALIAYLSKIYLAKGTVRSINIFLPNLPSYYLIFYQRILLD